MLREGADLALIEGVFEVEPGDLTEAHALLEEQELIDDPRVIVLAREMRREGRNLCRINGRVVSPGVAAIGWGVVGRCPRSVGAPQPASGGRTSFITR